MNNHKHITRILRAVIFFTITFATVSPLAYAISWSNDTPLTANPSSDYNGTITQTEDGKIWVLWHRVQTGASTDIYYRTYDGTWSSEQVLINNTGNDINPAVLQAQDGKFWLFWTSDITETLGNYNIFYRTSPDNGNSWSSDTQLTYTTKYLNVDNLIETISGNWTKTGASPYLHAIDYPTNYINQTTQSDMGSIGEFSFADISSYSGGNVYLEIWAKQYISGPDTPDTIEIWLYNQTLPGYSLVGTLTPDTYWSWKSTVDVSSILNTTSKINAAKAYLVKKTVGTAQNIEIDAMRIKIDLGAARRPSVMQAQDGKIWVAWHALRTGNTDLFYKVYDGMIWSDDTRLTSNATSDWEPTIMQTRDGEIWVFWSAFRTGDYEIFYKTSFNNGLSWSNETQLTNAKTSWDQAPNAIQTIGGNIWVVWQTNRGGQDYNIYYKTYNGSVWSGDVPFVQDQAEDVLPSIFQAQNKTILVTWSSTRADDYDIFYKSSIPDLHDVGISNVTNHPSIVYRGFQTQVQINVTVWNFGRSQETFSVTVYQNATYIGTQIVTLASNTEQILYFNWNALQLPYGYYAITTTVSVVPGETDITDNSFSSSIVTVTIPGDTNRDRTVDIFDVGKINAHWYDLPVIGYLGYDVDVDINSDGKIDLFDAAIINVNWGKSW